MQNAGHRSDRVGRAVAALDSHPPSKGGGYIFVVRELVSFLLRPDQVFVDGDFEGAAAGRDQHQRRDRVLLLLQQPGRQTDGLVGVVSGDAVLDCDFHSCPSIADHIRCTAYPPCSKS